MPLSRKVIALNAADGVRASEPSIRVPKAAELIAETIRRRVVQGELKSGDALPSEADLMTEFNVSRASLREAFRVLEAEALIEVKRGAHGGARIRLPTDDTAARSLALLMQLRGATLGEVFDARLIIEPPLMHRLAQIRTEADIAELRAHLTYAREHVTDWRAFGIAAANFHHLVVRQAGNVTLALVVGMLDEVYLRHLDRFIARDRPDQLTLNEASMTTWTQLIEAIEAKDGAAAEVIWRYHMQRSRTVILAELGENSPLAIY